MGDGDETGSTSLSANTASDTTSDTSSTLSDDSGGEKARLAIERIRNRGGADDLDSESLSLQLEEASFQNSFQHSAAGDDATPAVAVSSVADASLSVEGPVTVSPAEHRVADAGGLAETTPQMHEEASVERDEPTLEVAAPAAGVEMEASQDSTAAVLRLDDEALDNADSSDMIAGVSPVRSTASVDPHEVPTHTHTHTHTHTAALSSSASSLAPAPASELMSASLTAEELHDSLGLPAAAPTSTPTPASAPHGDEPDATPLAAAPAPAPAPAATTAVPAEAAHPPAHPPSPDSYTAAPAVPPSAAAPPATTTTTVAAAATPPAAHQPFVQRSPPSPATAQAQSAPVHDAVAAGAAAPAAAAETPVAQDLNDTLLMSPHQPQQLLPPLIDSVVRGASGRLPGDRLLRPAAAAAAASDDGEDHEDALDVMGDKEASTLKCLGVSARAPQARGLDARTLHGIAVLDVSSNDLEELPAMPPTLRRLDASRNRLRSITGLAKCEALEVLNLRRNRLTAIANLDRCFRLRHLFLGRNNIRRVQNIEHAIHLETLDLSSNLLSVTASLRPLSMNQALRTLVLRGNPLADPAGRKRICFAGLPPCATRLVLGGLCRMYGVVERIDMGEKASYVCFASGPDIASLTVRRLGGRVVEDADGTPYTVTAQVKPDSAGRKRRVWFSNIPDEDPVAIVSHLLQRACVLGAVDALEEQPARRWAFRDRGSSKWLPFDGKCSAHLTDAARRSADCMLESGGVCWDFNFETLTQRHPVSGRIRDLRPPSPTREVFVTFSSATESAERAKKLLHDKYLASMARDALEWPIDDAFHAALCGLSSLEPAVLNVRQMFDCFPLVMNLCPKLRCLDDKLLTQRGVVNTTAVASRVQTTLVQNRTGASAAVMSDTALTDDTELVARDGVNALDVSHLASGMARLAEEDESIRREKGWAPADVSAVSECPVKAHDKGPGLMKHRSEGYSVPGRAFDAARRMEAHDQVVKQEKVKKRLLMERVEPLPPTEPILPGNAAAAAASQDLRRRLDVTQSTDDSSSFTAAPPPPPPPPLPPQQQPLPSEPQAQPQAQQPLHADVPAQAAPQTRTLAASKSLGGNGWRSLHKAPSTSPRSSRPGVAGATGAPARVASPPQDRRRVRQQQPGASASAAPKRHVPAGPVRRRPPPQPSAADVSVFSGAVSGVDDSMASTALQLESVMNKMCKRRPRARVAPFGVTQTDAPVDGTSQLSAHPSAHSSFLTDVNNLSGISNVDAMLQQEQEQQEQEMQQRRSNSRGKVRFAPGSSPPSQQSHVPPQMARAQRRQAAVPTPDLAAAAAAAPVAGSRPAAATAPRPKERASLQEFVSEWLETFGNDFVTLHLALKTLLVLAEGGSSAEVVRYKDIVTSSGMLKEVEIPTEVVLGYGITEESQPPPQPVTERDKVLAMIAQMKQTKECLRYIFTLMDRSDYAELADYLARVKESLMDS